MNSRWLTIINAKTTPKHYRAHCTEVKVFAPGIFVVYQTHESHRVCLQE